MSSAKASFVDECRSGREENPVAAALIGGGALWLLMGSDNLKRADQLCCCNCVPVDEIPACPDPNHHVPEYHAAPAPPTAPDMDHGGSFGLGESLHDTPANSASDDTRFKRIRCGEGRIRRRRCLCADNF